ncbi:MULTISPECIES: Rv1733c family protein [Streptomyces]|uniref:Integral membrane protein n=2 Tax=Streptomyces rimosus subsp. rimosus TaxID=132474 RepID=L8EW43_STRR1|nr:MULTISPECIES: hypothetical protein [Streptomyces]KOG70157.1 hypothetical protein ADK78_30625 [Kitasatospora aureofaciens]MYT48342.1 hypothetical protein [Streptomyces sp. SID5471]KEF06625.1 hypothetical protein DF17_12690 [Streptomyces rimosus]KEF16723.1 hypothetical protein DF18_33610 [Streptomyces rimosus]KOT33945.1 hypothetical protein ADK42_23135 [Streptomyces rimosus subsp. rimosus]
MRTAKRWWRWRRNPLRRRVDVLEAWLGLLTALLLAVGAPAAGFGAASWAYETQSRTVREQQRTRHPVPAVLMQDVTARRSQQAGAADGGYPTKVRWKAPDGSFHTGDTKVSAGQRKGTRITVWVLHNGRLTEKPLDHNDALSTATATGIWAATGTGTAVFSVAWWIRRILERRRLDAWEREWGEVGPMWRRRTG